MRLGVLPRAGIVLSAFWLIGGTLWINGKTNRDWSEGTLAFQRLCMRGVERGPVEQISKGMMSCTDQANRSIEAQMREGSSIFWGSAGLALAGLVAAWIAIGILYGCYRFIAAGRKYPISGLT